MEIGSENLDLFITYWINQKVSFLTTAEYTGGKNVVR